MPPRRPKDPESLIPLKQSMYRVLLTLTDGDWLHGFGVGQRIMQMSADALRVEEGSLYPALYRIEQQGWIESEWGVSENNQRAKFYRLTAEGKKQLLREESRWAQLVNAIGRIMKPAPGTDE